MEKFKAVAGKGVRMAGGGIAAAGKLVWRGICGAGRGIAAAGRFTWRCLSAVGRGIRKAFILTMRGIGKAIVATVKFIGRIMDDIFLTAGFASLTIAGFKIYEPAGYAVMGCCFLAYAYLIAKR